MSTMPDESTEWFTLPAAPERIEKLTGRKVSVDTVRRWRRSGISGARLHCIRLGQTFLTCEAWLVEFAQQVQAATEPEPRPTLETIRAQAAEARRLQCDAEQHARADPYGLGELIDRMQGKRSQ